MGKKKQRKKFKKTFQTRVNEVRQKINPYRPSLFIAMPSYTGINPFTNDCLMRTLEYFGERGLKVRKYGPVQVSLIDKARNMCIEQFLRTDATHLIWIDDDMLWDAEDLEKMLLHNVPITSALVTQKMPPFKPTIYAIGYGNDKKTGEKKLGTYHLKLGDYPLDKPFYHPGWGIGTAFMMVKREVIEKMEPPYFASPPTNTKEVRGEDYYYCMKMCLVGKEYDILFDPTVRVYHMGLCPYGLEDYISAIELEVANEGEDLCQYTNINAHGVRKFKRFFAGPQISLIDKHADAVAKRFAKLAAQEESKSEPTSCPSSADGNQPKSQESGEPTTKPTTTTTEVSNSPNNSDAIKSQPEPLNGNTKPR